MQIPRQPQNKFNAILATIGAVGIIALPTATFAHGTSNSSNRSGNTGQRTSAQTTAARPATTINQPSSSNNSNQSNYDQNDDKSRDAAWAKANWNRHHSCDELQAALNWRAADSIIRDQKQLTGLNIMLGGVQTYVSSGSITVANYDALNTQATNDQTTASAAVGAISAPQLHCDASTSDKADQAAFTAANDSLSTEIRDASKSLQTYRTDVSKLFNATVNS